MKNKKLIITIAIIVIILIAIYNLFIGNYNKLVTLEENVSSQWAQVENVYQRRADLIPNLVETVKGYASHEKETFQSIVEARSKVGSIQLDKSITEDPERFAKFQKAQGDLSGALSRLLVVVENYPQLKANENFLTLQSQLEGTENRIAVERKRYNDVAMQFNTIRRRFPTIFIANLFGFREKVYFKAEEGAEKAPKVKF